MAVWMLVVPVIVACWLLQDRYLRALRRRAPVLPRFARLSRRTSPRRRGAALGAAICTAAALVFALTRPQALLASRTPEYERQDLIVMLDRSASMRAHDVLPSRFTRATLEIRNFLKHKPEAIDRVALIGFADSSLVLSYPTSDVSSLFFYLDWIDGDPAVLLGTNIGAALTSAREVARKDDRPTRKIFLIVSDGEDYGEELPKALATFRADRLRVHCIGIGSDDEVPIPIPEPDGRESVLKDDNGRPVNTKYSETTLRRIAETTGGRYVRSSTGGELTDAIADIVKGERKLLGWKISTDYRDLYPAGLTTAAVAGAALWLLL
jgi:Ca-activated chloride channel homolog